jgi:hypothetical protein
MAMAVMLALLLFLLLLFDQAYGVSQDEWGRITNNIDLGSFPGEFQGPPPPTAAYMVDDADLKKGLAPVHGKIKSQHTSKS